MEFKIKNKKQQPTASYSNSYYGIDEVYLVRNNKESHIFTNKLALGGGWINSQQLEDMIKVLRLKVESGDKLLVKSYKLRTLDKNHNPNGTPDVTWAIEIE